MASNPPRKLLTAVEATRRKLSPPPPRFSVVVEKKAPTFRTSYVDRKIEVPEFWNKFTRKCLHSFLGHEHKHVSVDGYPASYIEGKRHQAALMAQCGLTASEAHRTLNALYDSCINTRLFEEGFSMKDAINAWIKRFPIKTINPAESVEGTPYHLLQILHRDLVGASFPRTDYEDRVRQSPEFGQLLNLVKKLVRDGDEMRERKDADAVVEAADLFHKLAENQEAPESDGECKDGSEPVPADQREKVAEIAQDAGLDASRLKDLLGDPKVSEEEAEQLLEEATRAKARTEIWRSLQAFEDAKSGSKRDIYEPYSRRWKGHDVSKLDPLSVVLHKDEPMKWRERTKRPFTAIDQPYRENGFDEVIVIIDRSGSTMALYEGKQVFSYEKDAAIGAVGFAREAGIPVSLFWFGDSAQSEVVRGTNHMRVAEKIAVMKPLNESTNLAAALSLCAQMRPTQALLVVVTDGRVNSGDFSGVLSISPRNQVVCAVVGQRIKGTTLVTEANKKAIIVHVSPDSVGRTALRLLKGLLKEVTS